jgi:hypothetical protein
MNGTDGTNGEAGPPGPPGSGGGDASASISGITPPQSFLARTTEVTISGYGTNWSSTTTVDFGADVMVNKLTVASPTALVANITTSATAATGPRDVNVKDGTNTETYKGAFQVLSPLALTFEGTMAQGSLALVSAQVLDTSTPLDTTTDPFSGTYTNLAINLPAGITGQVISASDFSATIELFIDVPAAAGMSDFDVVSGPMGAPSNVDFPAPKTLTIAARTPTALTAGTPATGTTAAIYATSLYSFTPASASTEILDFTVSTTSSTATPALIILPSDGKWADEVASGQAATGAPSTFTWFSQAATALYGVTFDNSGATGPFSVGVVTTAASTAVADETKDGNKAGAVTGTLPFVLTGGDQSVGMGQDWVAIKSTTANQVVRAQTVGDPNTDTQIAVYQSNGTTQVGATIDTGSLADGTVTLPTVGTYYFVFSAGTMGGAGGTTFNGILR